MKKKWPFLVVLIIIVVALLVWFLYFDRDERSDTLIVSGNIEVTDVQLGFKITGRVEECLVDEGDWGVKGQLIARLENVDQRIAVELARARLAGAGSVLAEFTEGSRPQEIALARAMVDQARQMMLELTRGSRKQEIESAKSDLATALAAVETAQAEFTKAKADYDRFSALYKESGISQRDFNSYETLYAVATNRVTQAESRVDAARQALSLKEEGPRTEKIEQSKAALAQAEAEFSLVTEGPRGERIDQAQARVDEAQQVLNQALQQLAYTELSAPMDGVILVRSAEPGEFLNPSTPVVTLVDLEHPWLRAFINELDLGKVRLGDRVSVTTDSYPGRKYSGTLSFVASQAEFTPKSVQTFEERVKLMYRIKVDLSDFNSGPDLSPNSGSTPQPNVKSGHKSNIEFNYQGELKPGMPADALIPVHMVSSD
jgi:HlyD family secretion protein